MAEIQSFLTHLFQITRKFREVEVDPCGLIDQLFLDLFPRKNSEEGILFLDFSKSDEASLVHCLGLAEQLIAQYSIRYQDPRIIPVTYYKREKLIRRHLDHQFSLLFKEFVRRAGMNYVGALVLEEPIYYLMQVYRSKKFPKPKSAYALLEVVKARFHSDLVQHLGIDPFSNNQRRVLLPHELL